MGVKLGLLLKKTQLSEMKDRTTKHSLSYVIRVIKQTQTCAASGRHRKELKFTQGFGGGT